MAIVILEKNSNHFSLDKNASFVEKIEFWLARRIVVQRSAFWSVIAGIFLTHCDQFQRFKYDLQEAINLQQHKIFKIELPTTKTLDSTITRQDSSALISNFPKTTLRIEKNHAAVDKETSKPQEILPIIPILSSPPSTEENNALPPSITTLSQPSISSQAEGTAEVASRTDQTVIQFLEVRPTTKPKATVSTSSDSQKLKAAIDENNTQDIILLRSCVNNSLPNGNGLPLIYAIQSDKKEMVKILLENGADVLLREPGCSSAVEYAILSGNREVLALLLSHGIALKFEEVQKNLEHPMQRSHIQKTAHSIKKAYSAQERSELIDIVTHLSEKNIEERTAKQETLVHLAVQSGSLELIKKCLENAKCRELINEPDQNGLTPLHYAAALNNLSMAGYLCSLGAKLDAKDQNGFTPLMLVCADAEEHSPLHISLQQKISVFLLATLGIAQLYLSAEEAPAMFQTLNSLQEGLNIASIFASSSDIKRFFISTIMSVVFLYLQPRHGALGLAYTTVMATGLAISALKGFSICWKHRSLGTTQALKKALFVESPKLLSAMGSVTKYVGSVTKYLEPLLKNRLRALGSLWQQLIRNLPNSNLTKQKDIMEHLEKEINITKISCLGGWNILSNSCLKQVLEFENNLYWLMPGNKMMKQFRENIGSGDRIPEKEVYLSNTFLNRWYETCESNGNSDFFECLNSFSESFGKNPLVLDVFSSSSMPTSIFSYLHK